MLDDLGKELERRGHRFCRYAGDCNIYVRSQAAGERVLVPVMVFLEKRLRLGVIPNPVDWFAGRHPGTALAPYPGSQLAPAFVRSRTTPPAFPG